MKKVNWETIIFGFFIGLVIIIILFGMAMCTKAAIDNTAMVKEDAVLEQQCKEIGYADMFRWNEQAYCIGNSSDGTVQILAVERIER